MNRSLFFVRRAAAIAARRTSIAARSFGAGGAGTHSAGPYAPIDHSPYPSEAHPFGIDPSKPYKYEGWEVMTYVTYLLCFGMCTIGVYLKDDKDFKVWARREAIARAKVIEDGGEIEFGKYYQNLTFTLGGDFGDAMSQPAEAEE